jgi:hypothetical protein
MPKKAKIPKTIKEKKKRATRKQPKAKKGGNTKKK